MYEAEFNDSFINFEVNITRDLKSILLIILMI